jgi:monovalent cation:proton antiporter-2 (CPA2) family protein
MQETNYLLDILALLGAAVVAVPVFQRLGLGSVLGYLVAGVLVGPWGLGVIDQVEEIRHLAEFGVIFLLFVIGIELKPARLWIMRRQVFGLGSAQVILTGLVLAGLAVWFGVTAKTAVVVGFGLALSSTAFGLQILSERGQLGSVTGRTSFSVLLLQDLAIVPLLALVSLLAQDASLVEGVEYAVLQAALIIAVVILVGRFLLTPLLQLVASSRTTELFTATAILTVLGTAWLMSVAGLSMALGAFLAGLVLADSHYRHQVVADIQPFRGLLLGLFFMSVGMSIDFGLFGESGLLITGLVLGLLLIKALLLWGLCRAMGVGNADAMRVSLLLSQSGEFGFVLFGLALVNGVMAPELFQLLILVIALTMVTTPLMANLGEHLERYMTRKPGSHDVSTAGIDAEQPYIIVAGFGRVGRRIARILQAARVPYLALESNPDRVAQGRADGFSVFYGDASRGDVLQAAGSGQARVLVSTLDQPLPAVRLVQIMRQYYPETPIYARGHNSRHCDELLNAGATITVSETLEASLQLGAAVLEVSEVPVEAAGDLVDSFRREYYAQQDDEQGRKAGGH